ncbi:glycosyl hydrolases family 28-domain-containing protein [Amylostereum chailletii]|nr:glycosyl hydrolases family 28-domain-containing protein [Amylostereum chailletii]
MITYPSCVRVRQPARVHRCMIFGIKRVCRLTMVYPSSPWSKSSGVLQCAVPGFSSRSVRFLPALLLHRQLAITGTISSISDVAAAVACTTIVINAFTVPAGETFNLDLLDSTTVTMKGDVTFGTSNWAGPLFQVSGTNINFDGAGFQFNGNGAFYWDGQGINGGVTKPDPMMKIKMSGTFTNVGVLNSPARVYSVSNPAPLTMSHLVIDNSAGDAPNSKSGTASAGHNTDGFDVSSEHLTIRDSTIHNQDDCLAINNGDNIAFTGNTAPAGTAFPSARFRVVRPSRRSRFPTTPSPTSCVPFTSTLSFPRLSDSVSCPATRRFVSRPGQMQRTRQSPL